MKNLIIGLLTVFSAAALIWAVLPSENIAQYEPREAQVSEKTGIHGAVEWTHARRANPETGIVAISDIEKAKSQISTLNARKTTGLDITWENVGPTNIGGRTRALVIDKDNSDIMYAAGVSGGLWKSTTGGSSWIQIRYSGDAETQEIPNLAICSMCQAANGDIYFGTGEGHYKGSGNGSRGIKGAGMWKSTDGETFTKLGSTWNNDAAKDIFNYVNKLAADPNDANRIFAATNQGLRLTLDGGQTWNNVIDGVTGFTGDVKISTTGNTVITRVGAHCYVSKTNGNAGSFLKISGVETYNLPISGRTEFAIAPSDENFIYAQVANSSGSLKGIYKSEDKGSTWTVIGPGGSADFNPLGSQGGYDNTIAVFPDNKEEIIIGGQLTIWKYTPQAGWEIFSNSWVPSNNPKYVHADQHIIIFHPTNPNIVFVGSDGGIHRSKDRGNSWTTLNKNFNITQFYGISHSPTNEVLGGSQDNGTLYMDPDIAINNGTQYHYHEVSGGDGGYSVISQLSPNMLFSTIYYGQVRRTKDYKEASSDFYSSRLNAAVTPGDQSKGHNFVTPIAMWESFNDANNPWMLQFIASQDYEAGAEVLVSSASITDVRYKHTLENAVAKNDTIYPVRETRSSALAVGFSGSVWMSRFALNFSEKSWLPVAQDIGKVETLAWSKDGDNLYVANTGGQLYRISNFNNAYVDTLYDCERTSCVLTKTLIGQFGRLITSVSVDPNDANNVVVTMGNFGPTDHVYMSNEAATATDATTFSNKTGNLPDMPVYASVILWDDANKVLVGTEFGIYGTSDISAGTPSWIAENEGADFVPVYQLTQQIFRNGFNDLGFDSGIRNYGYIYAGTHGRGIFVTKTFKGPVSVETTEIEKVSVSLNIYPNPTTDVANVKFELEENARVNVSVFDINGRNIINNDLGNLSRGEYQEEVSVSHLPKGVYLVKLTAGNNVKTSRIVVE